jgi:patatin-like phospholipase/acyl hydrolase
MVGEETIFNDLKRRVVVPAVNLSDGEPYFFKTPHNPEFTRDSYISLVDAAMATSAAPTYFAPHYCEDRNAYFADGGLVANDPSFVGLHEVLKDMQSDFKGSGVKDVRILNIGTLGGRYSIKPSALAARRNNGYLGLWGAGERLVLTTMSANQQLHKKMLLRELRSSGAEKNYVCLDDTVPHEAASDITLDNASQGSLQNLASRGKQLATVEYTQNPLLRAFFEETADPFKHQASGQTETNS